MWDYGIHQPKQQFNKKLFKSKAEIEKINKKEEERNSNNSEIDMSIDEPEGEFTFARLRKMNTLKKNDYMDQILQHDNQIQTYLEKANAKAKEVST